MNYNSNCTHFGFNLSPNLALFTSRPLSNLIEKSKRSTIISACYAESTGLLQPPVLSEGITFSDGPVAIVICTITPGACHTYSSPP